MTRNGQRINAFDNIRAYHSTYKIFTTILRLLGDDLNVICSLCYYRLLRGQQSDLGRFAVG
jgi:hypothetical protein